MEEDAPPLKWSAQYTLSGVSIHRLHGDKIILPPAALEQLLSAATTIVSSNGASQTRYDYSAFANLVATERQQNLPHPLIFRLVNPSNGNVTYAGVREFSADEGEIELSPFLKEALGVKNSEGITDDAGTSTAITVHAQRLPKGTYVRFRPLEAGYNPDDWKALLEKYMRNTFTTLTTGQILSIPSGKDQYRFLIDKITPEGDGICIVDTDLEVDIEPLNEEQARETLKRIQAKAQQPEGSSPGGTLIVDQISQGHVADGAYVDFTVKDWDRSKPLEVELETEFPAAVDLYASPTSTRQRAAPRVDEHLFEDVSDRPSKRICIRPTNVEVEGSNNISISVSGYPAEADASQGPHPFSITVRNSDSVLSSTNGNSQTEVPPNDGDVRCKNCGQWVPGGRMFLHENFCLRNNVRCPKCSQTFQKASEEWREHWHCDQDDSFGNSAFSRAKHNALSHEPTTCTACGEYLPDTMSLARHRVTVCPEKEILCQFCHLLVPQKGPDDPDFTDPEVMLSGLTPHELADGARTTECHLCSKIVRLRDMGTHLKSHDLDRRSRPTPRLCRNVNCGRTLDGVGPRGLIKAPKQSLNDINLCDTCFGPLYNSAYDPESKALKRRVERRYLTQLVTGCGHSWCRNEYCKNGRFQLGLADPTKPMTSKDALMMTRPELEMLLKVNEPLHFCTDEASQKRRTMSEMLAASEGDDGKGAAYRLQWCIAALEAEAGDLGKGRQWLENFAPTRAEER